MKSDLIKGHLDLLVLTILSSGTLHGYAVIEQLRSRSGETFDLPEGTVYPALHRLERAGLLTSEWADVGGRRRRMYRLSAEGQRALAARRAEYERFDTAMKAIVYGATS